MSNQVRYVYIRVTGKGQYSISYLVRAECGCIRRIFFCQGISCVDFTSICGNEEYEVYSGERRLGNFKLEEMFPSKAELINSPLVRSKSSTTTIKQRGYNC